MADLNSKHEPSDSGKKGGGKGLIIGALVVIIILLIVVVVLLITRSGKEKTEAQQAPLTMGETEERKQVITEDNAEEIAQEVLEDIPAGIPLNYTVTQNSDWEFPDGKSPSINAYVENAKEDNQTPVYFDLVVDETGEKIYSSPVLDLGASLESITLDKELPKGSYPCTMTYYLVDDDQNALTTVNVGVTIHILN